MPNALFVEYANQWIDNMTSNRNVQDLSVQEYGENTKKWIASAVKFGENVARIGALYQKVVAMSAEHAHLSSEHFYAPTITIHNGAPMMDITQTMVTTHPDEVTVMRLRLGPCCPYLVTPPQAVMMAFNPTECVEALATKKN